MLTIIKEKHDQESGLKKTSKGRDSLPKYAERALALNSRDISVGVWKTTFKPANAIHTSLSAEDNSSKDLGLVELGFSVQYRGKPSRVVGSCLAQHTLKKLPFQPLKEFWKRVRESC